MGSWVLYLVHMRSAWMQRALPHFGDASEKAAALKANAMRPWVRNLDEDAAVPQAKCTMSTDCDKQVSGCML